MKDYEVRTVSFEITSDMLKFWNKDMEYVLEPGEFEIMVGLDSDTLKKVSVMVK